MVLPVPGGSDEGGGDRADSDVNPPEAEIGRAIYCDAADSGPMRGGSATTGGTGPREMVVRRGSIGRRPGKRRQQRNKTKRRRRRSRS